MQYTEWITNMDCTETDTIVDGELFCSQCGETKLKTKVGETTGRTLYSYDGAYWFSSPDAALDAARKLNARSV